MPNFECEKDSAPAGQLEGLVNGVAVGWARLEDDSAGKPIVEILCDGYPVAFDRADVFRQDLNNINPDSDGCIGFEIMLPRTVLLQGKTLKARFANKGTELEGEVRFADGSRAARRTLLGEAFVRGGLTLTGWVQPITDQPLPVRLKFFEGETLLGETFADELIPVQEASEVPALARAFTMRLPLNLADKKLHHVRVVDEQGRELKGSPLTVAAWKFGVPELLLQLAERDDVPVEVSKELLSLSKASESVGALLPVSADFENYEAWANAFSGSRDHRFETEPFTVIIFGEDDPSDSVASLETQNVPYRSVFCRDYMISGSDWLKSGFVAFLRAGDRLAPGALSRMAKALAVSSAAFSDSEQYVDGERVPWFKPDWDPDLFLSQSYVFGLLVLRATDVALDRPSQCIVDLAIRELHRAGDNIAHVAEVLYYQAKAEAAGEAPLSSDRMLSSIRRSPFVSGKNASVQKLPGRPWLRHVLWPCPDPMPRVSIIIPTRDRYDLLERAIETLVEETDYEDFELIIVDNNSTCPKTLGYLQEIEERGFLVLRDAGMFNYSRLNNLAVEHASGSIICLLNNDVEVTNSHWLKEMVGLLMRPDTGVVGAKLLWGNGMVQHSGVILGVDGGARHVGNRWMDNDPGYCGRNLVIQRYCAVTAACLVLRRSDYRAVGGLDEVAFPVGFNDVDLCLKIRERGKAVVWTPNATLLHHESASRGKDELPEKMARARRELDNLRRRWGHILLKDPAYNLNLNRDGDPFMGLALPPFLDPVRPQEAPL